MKKKLTVPIEEILAMLKRRKQINRADLKDIVWTRKGKPIKARDDSVEEFKVTGLNNIDYIALEYYK